MLLSHHFIHCFLFIEIFFQENARRKKEIAVYEKEKTRNHFQPPLSSTHPPPTQPSKQPKKSGVTNKGKLNNAGGAGGRGKHQRDIAGGKSGPTTTTNINRGAGV